MLLTNDKGRWREVLYLPKYFQPVRKDMAPAQLLEMRKTVLWSEEKMRNVF